ncbi:hypothetical protein J4417_03560 [Candidatus Woesearchaeota archaeon]|nr:hypothetical protein [Candidatus Woesearchaeota archaeon]
MINLKSLGLVGLVALSACGGREDLLTLNLNIRNTTPLVCTIGHGELYNIVGNELTTFCLDSDGDRKIDEVIVLKGYFNPPLPTVTSVDSTHFKHFIAEGVIQPMYTGGASEKLDPKYAAALDAICSANPF